MNKYLILTLIPTLLVAFMNFTFVDWKGELSLPDIKENSRIQHARELFGKEYQKSPARKLEGDQRIKSALLSKVRKQLPKRFKSQAADVTNAIIKEAARYNMDPIFAFAVIRTESGFNPEIIGRFGEIGLMQLKPDTAAWIAKKYKLDYFGPTSLKNPQVNISLGLAYFDHLRKTFKATPNKYVSAYNMGPQNVRKLTAQNIKPREYSDRVLGHYQAAYKSLAVSQFSPLVAIR